MTRQPKRCRHLLLWLFAVVLSGRASAEDYALVTNLRPDQAVSLYSTWCQMQTIDERPWDAYSSRSWSNLARYIHDYVCTRGNTQETWDTLRTSAYRECLPDSYQKYYGQLRNIAGGVDVETLSLKGDDGGPDELRKDAEGNIVVPLPKDMVEILWLLQDIEPWLDVASQRWLKRPELFAGLDDVEVLRAEVLCVVHDYVYAQKRLAKLRLIAALPSPLDRVVGVDRERLTELLDQFEQLTDYSAALDDVTEESLEASQRKLNEARQRAARELEPLLAGMERQSLRIKQWFDAHRAALQALANYYRDLLNTRNVDIPSDAASAGRPFVRLTIQPPMGEACRGTQTLVSATVFLCRVRPGFSVEASGDQATPIHLSDNVGSLPVYEQIPLGVTLRSLRFVVTAGQPPRLVLQEGGLAPTVHLDPPVLRDALHRLGVPEAITIGDLQVEVPRLDRYEISAQLNAPSFAAGLPELDRVARGVSVDVTIDCNDVLVDVNASLGELVREQVEAIQARHDEALRNALLGQSSAYLAIEDVKSLGRWVLGQIGYRVDLRLLRVAGQVVPESAGRLSVTVACERAGETGTWQLRLAATSAPARLLEWLRDSIAAELVQPALDAFDVGTLPAYASRLSDYVRIDDATYDPARQLITLDVVFLDGLLPQDAPPLPAADVTVDLQHGTIDLSTPTWAALRDRLKAEARRMLEELRRRIEGELNEEIARRLESEGVKLTLLGGGFRITQARLSEGRALVSLAGEGALEGFMLEDLAILKVDAQTLDVEFVDFSDAKFKLNGQPALQQLLTRHLRISQDLIRVSQEKWTVDGVSFAVALNLAVLGEEIPLGTVSLGRQGIDAKLFEGLAAQFERRLIERLARDALVLRDLGLVREVQLDPEKTKLLGGVEVWIRGKAEVQGFGMDFGLPFQARLAPSFDLKLDTGELKAAATAAFAKLLPADLLGGVEDVRLLVDTPPYGAELNLVFKAWVFRIKATGVRLTTAGFDLPAEISIQIPGMIPVPVAFAIVDPGVVIPLRRDGEVGIAGNVTLASEGIDKIVKLRSKLTSSLSELGTFRLRGSLVLVNVLPIMAVDGIADFRNGLLQLDSKTTGFIDKILQVRAQMRISAKDGEFRQPGSLGVLGFRLAETDLQILAFEPSVRAAARVKIPIATAMVALRASPSLDDFEARARFGFEVGDFTISEADLLVNARLVDLKFGVLIFDVRVIAPSLKTVTPGRVLKAILSLFDFDISAFFNALIKRKVTISFFENAADGPTAADPSIGQGEPLPPDPRHENGPLDHTGPPPGEPEPRTGARPEPTDGGRPPLTSPPPDEKAQPSAPPSSRHESPPNDRRDDPVLRYKTGDVAFDIIPDPRHSGLFVERYGWNGTQWLSSFSLTPHAAELLKQPSTMILGVLWRRTAADEAGRYKFRDGRAAWYVRYYIVLTKAGEVKVVPRFPGEEPRSVSIDLKKIGVEREPQGLFSWLLGQKEYRFTDGDLELIRDYAKALVTPGHEPIRGHEYIKTDGAARRAGFLPQPAGYLFVTRDERGVRRVEYITRTARRVVVCETAQLYRDLRLEDGASTLRAQAAFQILSGAAEASRPASYFYGESAGPILLAVAPGTDDPASLLYAVKTDGSLARPIRLDPRHFHGYGGYDARWPPGDLLGKEISQQAISDKWHELLMHVHSNGEIRVILAHDIDSSLNGDGTGTWEFTLLRVPAAGGLVTEGVFAGGKIEADWGKRVKGGALRATPFDSLSTPAARRWLLNELMVAPEQRSGRWVDDPLDLMHLYLSGK